MQRWWASTDLRMARGLVLRGRKSLAKFASGPPGADPVARWVLCRARSALASDVLPRAIRVRFITLRWARIKAVEPLDRKRQLIESNGGLSVSTGSPGSRGWV